MPSSQLVLPLTVNPARRRPAALKAAVCSPAAAAPTRLVAALAVLAWAAWAVFAVTIGFGGTPHRGLGAVSFVTAIVACVAFCGVHAWQTRLVRRLALTCAVAAYGYTALAYVFAADAAARFPSLYDAGLFAFYS